MSPSSHRRRSGTPGPEQRQQALIGLTIVLAFVVVGMIIVLARQDQPFTVGDVALPVHDLAKPVVRTSSSAAVHDTSGGTVAHKTLGRAPSHTAGVAGVVTTR